MAVQHRFTTASSLLQPVKLRHLHRSLPSFVWSPPSLTRCAAGNRRTTLGSLLKGALEVALSRLHLPEVALGEITLTGGTLDAHVHGEALPRRFADVRLVSATWVPAHQEVHACHAEHHVLSSVSRAR